MIKSLFNYFSVGRNSYNLPRNELSACLQRTLDSVFNSAAAGNLHSYNLNAFNVVVRNNLRQLFGIVSFVELGAANERYVVANKFVVEVAIGKSCAVGSDEKICALEIRGVNGHKLNLNRPL